MEKLNPLNRINKMLKKLIFPVTPLVVITALSIIFTIWAVIIVFTSGPTAALIGAIAAAINLVIIVLYIIDRMLVRKIEFKTVVLGELFLGILIAFFFYYNESTIDINIATDSNQFVVLFDSEENSLADFEKNGLFGKKLNVYNHIIHVDSSLYNNKDLRINEPDEWGDFYGEEGTIQLNGKLVKYILRTHDNPQLTIENLLEEIENE
jgi:hypothetical protein